MSGVVSVGVAVGATAFAATDIAAAGLTLGTALEATAAVGAVVGAVGKITGNKALTIAGFGLGIVGGVGALATSAGLFGADAASGASLFGSSNVTAGAAGGTGVGGAFTGADASSMAGATGLDVGGVSPLAGTNAATPGGISDIIDGLNGTPSPSTVVPNPVAAATPPAAIPQGDNEGGTLGTTNNPAASGTTSDAQRLAVGDNVPDTPASAAATVTGNTTPPLSNSAPSSSGILNGPGTPAAPSAPAVPGAPAPVPAPAVTGAPSGTLSTDLNNPAAAGAAATSKAPTVPAAATPTPLSTLMDFLKSGDGRIGASLVQAGGALVAGATSTLTPAQVAALNAQANANQAAANLSQRQLANTSSPIPIATRTAAPPSPNGIINRLPPPNGGPIVTGTPA